MILKHNVNVEQTSKGRSSTASLEQSLVVKTRHKEARIRHQHKVSSTKDFDDSDDKIRPLMKILESAPITAVCSDQQHQHIEIMIE